MTDPKRVRSPLSRRNRIVILIAILLASVFIGVPVISNLITQIRCPNPEEGFVEGHARLATPLASQYEHGDHVLTVELDDGRRVDVHAGSARYRHNARVVLSYKHRCAPDGPVFFSFAGYKPE